MQKVACIIQYDHKETHLHEAEKDAFRKQHYKSGHMPQRNQNTPTECLVMLTYKAKHIETILLMFRYCT